MDINGHCVVGQLLGVKSKTRESGGNTYVNHDLGVLVGSYQDDYGVTHQDVLNVSINKDDLARVSAMVEKHKEKQVIFPVLVNARVGGKNGAWLSTYLPKDAAFLPLK